jgi:hypothetical protein
LLRQIVFPAARPKRPADRCATRAAIIMMSACAAPGEESSPMEDGDIDWGSLTQDLAQFSDDEVVQGALQRGVDLKRYGAELAESLKQTEAESVAQYVENSPQVSELHRQMQECDAVLARMQDMLLGFQADLGGISEEIKHLQDESLSMSIRLKNRKAAEERLRKFIDNSSVSPDMAASITSPTVNDAFLDAVLNLSKKLKYLQQLTPAKDGSSLDLAPAETFAGRTMLPELEKLKAKALTKAKDYFASQFNAIRKPKTNVQVLQQTSLIKYAGLFRFLQLEAPHIADELRAIYMESMGRTLHNLFKAYYNQMLKLDAVMASKSDLVAVEEATLKSVFTQKVINMAKRNDSFSLAGREKILDQIESEPVLLHVAVAEGQRFPYEAIVRSILKHLVDAATNEFLFVIDFFKTNSRDTFNKIFGRTLSQTLENLENYLLSCYDAVGLLLMIKITHSMRMIMQRRRIPALDSFFDRVAMLLWPRLKAVLDANVRSVRSASVKKMGPVDLTPHYVCKRYAELVSSIFILQGNTPAEQLGMGTGASGGSGSGSGSVSGGNQGETTLTNDITHLRTELVSLLERLSTQLVHSKERRVFFVNNYDQILTIFQERRVLCDEVQKVEDLLMQQRELFAEEQIRSSFPNLISFVVQTEQALNSSSSSGGASKDGQQLSLDESLVEGLVRDFSANWKMGIQHINDDVMVYFANFRSGMEILKQVLTQLLLYYTRFQDIIKKAWPRPPAFSRELVSTATIMMEIRRFSRNF